MALLGEDGRGYELARKLESCGVWRTWLGDSTYASFAPFLSSPSAWDSFIRTDPSNTRAHIHLQLRVRALLFDKASSATATATSSSISHLNPSFLRLHPDDLYFTLDQPPPKNQSKTSSGYRNDDLPETWYTQVIENYKANKKLLSGDRESPKRSSVEMASYVKYTTNQKRRRLAFKEENRAMDHASAMQPNGAVGGNFVDDNDNDDGDESVFPEVTFMWNCVPESALPVTNRVENNHPHKVKLFSVLDTLPPLITRNPVMIERLGLRPEHLSTEHGGSVCKFRPQGSGRVLGPEQATKLSQKVVARVLLGVGFEASMEGPVEYFSEMLSKHIVKIGTNLKVLADGYKKQCSAIELLKMLLKTVGFSNFSPLVDVVKDGSKNIVQQSQQQVHGSQLQMQPQQQSSPRLPQHVQQIRQMQQILHSRNLAIQQQQLQQQQQQQLQQQQQQFQQQQQLERLRTHPTSSPRPAMDIDKERPLVQVKIENQSDLPIDGNSYNSRHPQMQFRQQQMAAMSSFHPQSSTQFRQMGLQAPAMQALNIGLVRARPVKVEGFQELMGGDSTTKNDSEENRLTSPTGK